jgi:hypothetical protein
MPLEEPQTHREWIEVWKLTHAVVWQAYANCEENERLLLEGAQRCGRPCRSAVDRAFQDVRAVLVRTENNPGNGARREAQHGATQAQQSIA